MRCSWGEACLAVSGDEHVQFFVLSVVVFGIPCCTFLHGATPTNRDLCVGLHLHALLCISSGTDDEAYTAGAVVGHVVTTGCTPPVSCASCVSIRSSDSMDMYRMSFEGHGQNP